MNEQELFLSALEIEDAEARRAHVQTACADNPELLKRVESLLASHESQSQFLNTPVVDQMTDEPLDQPSEESDATMFFQNGPTQDDEFATTDFNPDEDEPMTEFHDDSSDEIALGYLQPSTKPDSIGRLAHYEIQEVIGRGAFGTVLKAFDEKLHRVVAIKVLAPEMAATSPARKRFLREARSSAAVRHENVVSIYAVEDDPIPYLVMEYIPGKTLQQRLDEHGPLDLRNVLRLGKQMADGLAAAHDQQLIHRDVKPGNILLETSIDDRVKITDFGLARAADDASMTQSGMITGTPLYMAPEQALGQKLDQRADLFSLGSVLYQMLTGRPPFRARNTLAVLKRVTEDTPRPIQEVIPEIPEWMCEIVARLHAKEPDDRYASARDVADLLERCLTELERGNIPNIEALVAESTVTLTQLHADSSVAKSRRSRRPLLKVAAIALVLASLGVALNWWVTPSGRLVIETDDPNVTVTIDRDGNVVTEPAQSEPVEAPAAPPLAKASFDKGNAKEHQKAWAEHLGVPVEKEIILGKDHKGEDLKLTMVLIPPGEFLMGTNGRVISDLVDEAKATNPDARTLMLKMEGPQHFVKITKPFWLSKYEFKTGLFRRFVESTGYKTTAETDGVGGARVVDGKAVRDPDVCWDMLKGTRGDFGPVVNVSHNDALACCAWLSKLHPEMAFSLPTEAQWEYACRAGTTTPWYGCKTADELEQYAWFDSNAKWIQGGGRLKPNAFGIYDMHGNVWEWCLDWASGIYGKSPSIDPVRLEDVEHPLRVNRGGSFMNPANDLRSAKRGVTPPDNSFFDRGFRVAAGVVPKGRQPNSPPAAVTKNYALSFDGKDDYVEIPSLKPAVDNPMTVEVICRVVDLNQSTLVDLGSRETSEFVLRTDAQQWRFERSTGSKLISTRGSVGLKPEQFVHIAGVWNGSRLSLFINGAPQPASNAANESRRRTQIERLLIGGLGQGIGNQSAPPTEYFGGMLKALRISRTARYTSRFTAPTDFKSDEQTLAVYQFHSGTGNVLRDTSGNGHEGTIHGATWVQTDGTPLTTSTTQSPADAP